MILSFILVAFIIIYLVGFTVERLMNDITDEVAAGYWDEYWEKEGQEDESTGFLETVEETGLHDFKQND